MSVSRYPMRWLPKPNYVHDGSWCWPDTSRRPLFTDTERKHMSEVIVLSTTTKSIPNILSEIELELDDQDSVANPTDLQLQRGPFGAFRVNPKPAGLPDTSADQLLYSGPATDLEPLDIPAFNETLLDFDLDIEELDNWRCRCRTIADIKRSHVSFLGPDGALAKL